jgi:hypothetical protein
VPYCGPTTYGGASTLALAIARRLDAHVAVEVLTTCAVDYETWANAVPAGHERVDGVHVRRFAVDRPRDKPAFERLSRALIYDPDPSLEDQERWMRAQGPYSTALLEYLEIGRFSPRSRTTSGRSRSRSGTGSSRGPARSSMPAKRSGRSCAGGSRR